MAAADVSGFPPRLIIIGAQKAGTTSFAELLATHSQIAMGEDKEPDFYAAQWTRGMAWYRGLYAQARAPWLIDASPSYSTGFIDPETHQPFAVAERLARTVPDARLIYLVRDPVKRAYSSYWHERRYGSEKRAAAAALTPQSVYVRQSLYDVHLRYFQRHFPAKHILTLRFEDINRQQSAAVDRVCAFLGLQPEAQADKPVARNQGFQYAGPARMLETMLRSPRLTRSVLNGLKAVVPQRLRPLAKRLTTAAIPPIDPALAADLTNRFEPHIQAFEAMTGLDCADWQRGDGAHAPLPFDYPTAEPNTAATDTDRHAC
ncbi:MAG: sulfotransferase [Rhodothalassiaceae bacterium]